MRVEHCQSKAEWSGMHGTFIEGSEKGESENEKQAYTLFAPVEIERRQRASITFFRRATPFTSVKLNRQVQSVIHQPARSRSRGGKSDMEALVGSLRAVCCPCGRASKKPWRKQSRWDWLIASIPHVSMKRKFFSACSFPARRNFDFLLARNLNCFLGRL